MMTRREALGLLGSMSAASVLAAAQRGAAGALAPNSATPRFQGDATPPLAPGAPSSPERLALIAAFKRKSEGIEQAFEPRIYKAGGVMPYRLFRPDPDAKGLPLVLYLHGSGGLGDDDVKQMGLGNIFGTRVWALPENQKRFPCYVVAPQADRGWVRYGPPAPGDSVVQVIPSLGEGARLALQVVDALRAEFAIDERRLYVTGQSMGGGGAWHLIAQRPGFFAAAVVCCGGATLDPAAAAASTPLWNFHGTVDTTVPPAVSRDRIAGLRKAGGRPLSTEYAGVGHNVWEWAYTEPQLLPWMFSHRRRA